MDSNRPVLSVVIVNYNGLHFLPGLMESLRQHVSGAMEVIVVDNASQDGSSAWIREHHPWVRLIRSAQNLGFTRGNNIGAQAASGEYLLLLNNDTVVQASLEPMLNIMRFNPSIGVLGCTLKYGNGCLQESVGYAHTLWRLICSWLPLKKIFPHCEMFRRTADASSGVYGKSFAVVDWVSGACLMTPLALWKKLGGLDERYFMYVEDVDYCRRVSDAGYNVAYSACTTVTHFEGAGRAWVGSRAVLNTSDSYLIFARKYFSGWEQFVLRLFLPVAFAARAAVCFVVSLLVHDMHQHDKAKAFATAAWRMFSGNTERA